MQGTIAVLMVLSGLGCHHKSCEVAVPTCYSMPVASVGCDGCGVGYGYASYSYGCGGCGAYTAPVYPAPAIVDCCPAPVTYASCGSPCGRRRGLFGCHKRQACCMPVPTCYSSCFGYGMPVAYGDYTAAAWPSAQYPAPQAAAAPQGTVEPAPPATTPAPSTAPAPAPASEPSATPPPPTPAPSGSESAAPAADADKF